MFQKKQAVGDFPPLFEVLFIYDLAFLFQYFTDFIWGKLVFFQWLLFFFVKPPNLKLEQREQVTEENNLVSAVELLFVLIIQKGEWK